MTGAGVRWRGVVGPYGLRRLDPADEVPAPHGSRDDEHPAARELRAYFAGTLRTFRTPVDLTGTTAFRRRVLAELVRIPYGETRTYGEIAVRVGSPRGARAIGQAVGSNPVPIVVPCHRVLAAHAKLGGFSSGLQVKRALLQVESVAWRE